MHVFSRLIFNHNSTMHDPSVRTTVHVHSQFRVPRNARLRTQFIKDVKFWQDDTPRGGMIACRPDKIIFAVWMGNFGARYIITQHETPFARAIRFDDAMHTISFDAAALVMIPNQHQFHMFSHIRARVNSEDYKTIKDVYKRLVIMINQ